MRVIASSVRKGNVLDIEGRLYVVLNAESFFPGKGTPTTQIDMRRISDGVKTQQRYKTTEQVERATVEEREYQFLYQDGDGFHFMNMENYEQLAMQDDVVGDQAAYLHPEMKVKLSVHEGTPIAIELPQKVVLEVTDTEPTTKGQTASSSYKPATSVERRAHQRPAFHRDRHAHRGDDGGRQLRGAREGVIAVLILRSTAKPCVSKDGPALRPRPSRLAASAARTSG